jgi:hypothetical protein
VSTESISLPLPSTAKLAQHWQTAKTAAKTLVLLLAIIGAAHVTEPLRADAAVIAPTPSPAGSKVGAGHLGK